MDYLWKDAALLNLKTYWLKTTTMVVTAHNFEGREFKQLGNYAPRGTHWGPSLTSADFWAALKAPNSFSDMPGAVLGTAGSWSQGTPLPLHVISGSPHVSLQQGHRLDSLHSDSGL